MVDIQRSPISLDVWALLVGWKGDFSMKFQCRDYTFLIQDISFIC